MKNLITIIALTICTSAFAGINPDVAEINTESVAFIASIEYDADSQNLAFTTTTDISVLQIFNAEGNLEFQLPVMSDIVKINKNLFNTGKYKLGFVLEGDSEVHLTEITIK